MLYTQTRTDRGEKAEDEDEEGKGEEEEEKRRRRRRRRRKSDVLIIRGTFCCHGVFVSTKDEKRNETEERAGVYEGERGRRRKTRERKKRSTGRRKQTGSMPLFVKARRAKATYLNSKRKQASATK